MAFLELKYLEFMLVFTPDLMEAPTIRAVRPRYVYQSTFASPGGKVQFHGWTPVITVRNLLIEIRSMVSEQRIDLSSPMNQNFYSPDLDDTTTAYSFDGSTIIPKSDDYNKALLPPQIKQDVHQWNDNSFSKPSSSSSVVDTSVVVPHHIKQEMIAPSFPTTQLTIPNCRIQFTAMDDVSLCGPQRRIALLRNAAHEFDKIAGEFQRCAKFNMERIHSLTKEITFNVEQADRQNPMHSIFSSEMPIVLQSRAKVIEFHRSLCNEHASLLKNHRELILSWLLNIVESHERNPMKTKSTTTNTPNVQ
jgi:hypothetical protein